MGSNGVLSCVSGGSVRAWPGAKIESAGSQRKDQLGGAAGAPAAAWTPPFNAHQERCEQVRNEHKSVLLMLAAPGVGGDKDEAGMALRRPPTRKRNLIIL